VFTNASMSEIRTSKALDGDRFTVATDRHHSAVNDREATRHQRFLLLNLRCLHSLRARSITAVFCALVLIFNRQQFKHGRRLIQKMYGSSQVKY